MQTVNTKNCATYSPKEEDMICDPKKRRINNWKNNTKKKLNSHVCLFVFLSHNE